MPQDPVPAPNGPFAAPYADLLARLDTLDFTDFDALITWLCDALPLSEIVSPPFPAQQVLTAFRCRGFLPSVNAGPDINLQDRESGARFVIAQALEGLMFSGPIYPLIPSLARRWRERFPSG